MTIWIKLALIAGIFLAGLASGVKIHAGLTAQRDLAAVQAGAKERARRVDKIDAAATGHEADKAQIRTQFKTIIKEVDRVVQNPVYLHVCFDDDGLRAARAAIGPAAPASQPAPALPEPARAD